MKNLVKLVVVGIASFAIVGCGSTYSRGVSIDPVIANMDQAMLIEAGGVPYIPTR